MVKGRESMGSKGRKIAILLATRGPSDDGLIFKVAIIEIGIIRWVLGVEPLAGCTKSRQRMRLWRLSLLMYGTPAFQHCLLCHQTLVLMRKKSLFLNSLRMNLMRRDFFYHSKIEMAKNIHFQIFFAIWNLFPGNLAELLTSNSLNLKQENKSLEATNIFSQFLYRIYHGTVIPWLHCKFFPHKKCGGYPWRKTYPVKCM